MHTPKSTGNFVRYQLPLLAWMVVIFISSSIPGDVFPQVKFWGWAKLIHLIYYYVLGLVVNRAVLHQSYSPFLSKHHFLSSVLFGVLYGAFDEFHQQFTPGRHSQLLDVAIDTLGVCLFVAGISLSHYFRRKKADGAVSS